MLVVASQLTWTAGAESKEIVALPPAPSWRRTCTTTVTLWPALSWPDDWLIVRSGDDLMAVQLTGPPLAVSTIWPADAVPRSRLPGLTLSWPAADGLADADGGAAATLLPGEPGTAGPGSSATPMARCGARAGVMTEGVAVTVARVS